jgi:hypothetical protein
LSWWLPEALSSKVKQQRMKLTTHLSSTAEVKNGGAIPPLPHSYSWQDGYSIKHKENFTFYYLSHISSDTNKAMLHSKPI